MEKRTIRRVKRRITCEFSHDGGAYKGIVLDLDHAGLFIRTNATIAPGNVIEILLAVSAVAPAMTLRVQVARRRLVPANLSSLLNRGLGVRILEAPREYGQLIGVGLLDAPIRIQSSMTAPTRDPDSAVSAPSEPESTPTAEPEPVATPSTLAQAAPVSPSIPRSKPCQASSPAHAFSIDIPSPKPPRSATAVLVGGTELDAIADVLVELAVDVVRKEPTDPELAVFDAPRLIVVSARTALAHTIPLYGADTVSIAVCDEASKTTRTLLEGQGFQYLLRQPVYTDALRLLFRYALFDQPDRRAQKRLPFGYEVSWRVGWRPGWGQERGPILEISPDGCRLLAADSLPLDTRIHIKIPGEATRGRPLKVRGTVIRCSPHKSMDQLERIALAVVFDDLSPSVRERLALVCDVLAAGPPVLPTAAPAQSDSSDGGGDVVTEEGTNSLVSETSAAEVSNDEEWIGEDSGTGASEPIGEESDDVVAEEATEEEETETEGQAVDEDPTEEEAAEEQVIEAGTIEEEKADSEPPDQGTAGDESSAVPTDRRQFSRSRLDREIVEIDAEQHVVQALLGRDLSMGGIRIDPQSDLEAGDKLRLAIFDTSRRQPLILHAVVSRDDGLAGMGLHFVDVSADAEAELAEMITGLPALESLDRPGWRAVVPAGILADDEKPGSIDTKSPPHGDALDSNQTET